MVRTPRENGWSEWKNHVLAELKRQNKNIESLDSKLDGLKTSLVVLKIKSSIWGLLGGVIPIAIMILVEKLKP